MKDQYHSSPEIAITPHDLRSYFATSWVVVSLFLLREYSQFVLAYCLTHLANRALPAARQTSSRNSPRLRLFRIWFRGWLQSVFHTRLTIRMTSHVGNDPELHFRSCPRATLSPRVNTYTFVQWSPPALIESADHTPVLNALIRIISRSQILGKSKLVCMSNGTSGVNSTCHAAGHGFRAQMIAIPFKEIG